MSANLEDPEVAIGLEKGQSSSQSPRRVVPKNVLTIGQLHSSPMLVWSCLNLACQVSALCEPRTSKCPTWVWKRRETRGQIANIFWIIEKGREFQKKKIIYHYFIDYAKTFNCLDHDKQWKALRLMGIPDHLNCFLRNLYAGQEVTVRTLYGTTDWFKIEKGVRQALCCHSVCLTCTLSTS